MKTSTKRKAISKKEEKHSFQTAEGNGTIDFPKDWGKIKIGSTHVPFDEIGVDNDLGIDVPLHARGGAWKWNFEQKPSFMDINVNRVTWVLTAVNVAILISLIVKNTMYDAN